MSEERYEVHVQVYRLPVRTPGDPVVVTTTRPPAPEDFVVFPDVTRAQATAAIAAASEALKK